MHWSWQSVATFTAGDFLAALAFGRTVWSSFVAGALAAGPDFRKILAFKVCGLNRWRVFFGCFVDATAGTVVSFAEFEAAELSAPDIAGTAPAPTEFTEVAVCVAFSL